MIKIGVISDTHGLLREEVISLLKQCDLIFHAGDINKQEIVERLSEIAPVKAVRGNNDKGSWAEALPEALDFTVGGKRFYIVHQKKDVPEGLEGVDLFIVGHSHKYSDAVCGGRHFLNPGSCGKRRFDLPVTLAVLTIQGEEMTISKVELAH